MYVISKLQLGRNYSLLSSALNNNASWLGRDCFMILLYLLQRASTIINEFQQILFQLSSKLNLCGKNSVLCFKQTSTVQNQDLNSFLHKLFLLILFSKMISNKTRTTWLYNFHCKLSNQLSVHYNTTFSTEITFTI